VKLAGVLEPSLIARVHARVREADPSRVGP